ncbi:zinc finger BED domain-containing protein RICESLEEPER 2-like protein [Tanacetum coccineum]
MILQCPPSMSNISKRILSTSSSKDFATFDSIGFWKQRKNQFPVLYRMVMDILSVQVQQNKATQLTDQEIALDASSDGSSGEPRHDYMMSSGAEDDQTRDGHDGSTSYGYY